MIQIVNWLIITLGKEKQFNVLVQGVLFQVINPPEEHSC